MIRRFRGAKNPYYSGPVSDHFDGVRFFAPGPTTDKSFAELWRWRRTRRPAPWPAFVETGRDVPPPRVEGEAIRVSFIGHASVLAQTAGVNLLFDPVLSERASPVSFAGPKRVTAPGVAEADLPPLDAVLVSHSHYDHLDAPTLRRLAVSRPCPVIVPLGVDALLGGLSPRSAARALDWGQSLTLPGGVVLHLEPARHWSARGLFDRRMTLWGSFVVETPTRKIWFAGDTGWDGGAMAQALARKHGGFDLALIPIGAYAPRWFMASQHVDPAEAVALFEACGAKRALAIHWGAFQLTDEPRDEPPRRLAKALAARGIEADRFVAVEPGATLTL